MCIRDSSSADKNAIQVAGHYSAHIGLAPSFTLTGLQISLQSGSIIITDMLHRPVLLPVSYTHLDVYKRQQPYLPDIFKFGADHPVSHNSWNSPCIGRCNNKKISFYRAL